MSTEGKGRPTGSFPVGSIISASRRTDIPAFYMPWFIRRLREGFVLVPNPFNPRQISRISLDPGEVVGIVFWSKNPRPLLRHLPLLDQSGFRYYVQYTITCYPRDLEPKSPEWREAVDTFRRLADHLGPQRVIWRYDPIILSSYLDLDYHLAMVQRTARALEGSGCKLVLSFIDLYRKSWHKLRATHSSVLQGLIEKPNEGLARQLMAKIAACAAEFGFQAETCAETMDFEDLGIRKGRCIDPSLLGVPELEHVLGKDPGQRRACQCVRSRDIGMYDSCALGCVFCYANSSSAKAEENRRRFHRIANTSLLETRLSQGDEKDG